ncbi:MAG TPA: hypothetical protein VNZ52_05335 [Candidatus Thermoplasmatota archaeon]|nr:hypothetical protein [Candidatus Thermoplasmatota archaeon]
MATLDELRLLGPFVVDPDHARIHRADTLTEACAHEVDPGHAQAASDLHKATLILKTRHYSACPRCWAD